MGLVSHCDKAHGGRKGGGVLLIRSRSLGELHEISRLEQGLHLLVKIRRDTRRLQILEYLCRRHLHRVYAVARVNIFPQSVRDSGIESLLLLRYPVFAASEVFKLPQRHKIRRILTGRAASVSLPPGNDQHPDHCGHEGERQYPQDIRNHLGGLERIADLAFDVVDLIGRRVNRHRTNVQHLRVEDEGVHPVHSRSPYDGKRRKFVPPLVKRCHNHRDIYVVGFRLLLSTFHHDSVGHKRHDNLHAVHEAL